MRSRSFFFLARSCFSLVDGDALVMLLGEKGEQPFGIEWRLPRFEQMEIGQTLIEK